MSLSENKQRMARGELYYAFTPELVAERARCKHACARYNNAGEVPRRKLTELLREYVMVSMSSTPASPISPMHSIIQDKTPMPPQASTSDQDDKLFENDPWVEPPLAMDYGYNVRLGENVFINFNSVFLDTCLITIGSRTLVGPNVSFYSGTHPLDPAVRDGTRGPELGKEIHVGEDCWIGGNVSILPGVNIGRGSVVGAGSVVTKTVPEYTVVAGNPARIIRKVVANADPPQSSA